MILVVQFEVEGDVNQFLEEWPEILERFYQPPVEAHLDDENVTIELPVAEQARR